MFEKPEDIRKVRVKLGLTQEQLAEKLNLTRPYMSYVEKGLKRLSLEKINALKQLVKEAEKNSDDTTLDVDFYPDIFASCGAGSYVLSDNKETRQISKSLLPGYSDANKYSICTARGDSMDPTIKSGNLIIVRHYENEQINDNDIYIFCYNDELYVKRLSKNLNELIITSDNPQFCQIILKDKEMAQVKIIGKIVGVLYK